MTSEIELLRQKILDDLKQVGKRDYPSGMTQRLKAFIEKYLPEVVITKSGRSERIQLRTHK